MKRNHLQFRYFFIATFTILIASLICVDISLAKPKFKADYNKKKQEAHVNLEIMLPEYNLSEENEWMVLNCDDINASHFFKKGEPNLVSFTYDISIPSGASVKEIIINPHSEKVRLSKPIKPAPEPMPVGAQPIPPIPNEQIYSSLQHYPQKDFDCSIAKQGTTTLLVLTLYPFKYIGKNQELIINEYMDVEIVLNSKKWRPNTKPSNAVDKNLKKRLVNEGKVLFFEKCARLTKPASLITGNPADYIIITLNEWQPALDYYVAKKTEQGYKPRVFALQDIYATYEGTEDYEKIRNFIKDAFDVWNISYVLLVGDSSIPYGKGDVEFDSYYILLDGDMDQHQDAYIGRLPADNYEEVLAISTKWANYQTREWGRSEFCLTGADAPVTVGDDFDIFNWNKVAINGLQVFDTIQPEDIVREMNSGYGLINWQGHGYENLWAVCGSYYFYTQDAYELNNSRLSFVNAICSCLTGSFSSPNSIGKAFIKAPLGGAIGYIGANATVSGQVCEPLLSGFYNTLLEDYLQTGYVVPGTVIGGSRIYNLLGDPTAKMDLLPLNPDSIPPEIVSVQYTNNDVLPGQSTYLLVTATDNDCVGVVTAKITKPDGTILEKEMTYDKYDGRYEVRIGYTDTAQSGRYSFQISAKDISQNQISVAGPDLTVIPDTEPPQITSVTIAPQPVYQCQAIYIDIEAIDDSGALLSVTAEITKPSGEMVVASGGFYDTQQVGTYNVVAYAKDYAGNESAPYHSSFEVLADTEFPIITDTWVSNQWCNPGGIVKITSAPIGAGVYLYETATDDKAELPFSTNLKTWAEITKPDTTVISIDLIWQGGFFPEAYNILTQDLDLVGIYSIIYYAQDQSGNTSASLPLQFEAIADTTPPTGSIVINSYATYTNSILVTLLVYATDDGKVTQMRFSNDGTTWSDWETYDIYTPTKAWFLDSVNGTKTVYVQFKDLGGNISLPYTDTIILDTIAPTGSFNIHGGIAIKSIYTDIDDLYAHDLGTTGGSGISQMRFSNDAIAWTSWEAYSTAYKPWTLLSGDGLKTVYGQFKDNAGNISQTATDTIILDTVAPTGSIIINDGDPTTTSPTVNLTLSAEDSGSGIVDMKLSNDGVNWTYSVYTASKSWTLTPGDGTKTVYVQFRDLATNNSPIYTDTITLEEVDTQPPSIPANLQAAVVSPTQIDLNWDESIDSVGVAGYNIYRDAVKIETVIATSYSDTGLAPSTTYAYSVSAFDAAGNESGQSEVVSATTLPLPDTTPPTGSIVVNSGDTYTKLALVTLSVSAIDTGSGVSQMRFANNPIDWSSWETYATIKAWTLAPGDGTKTVYAQFQDVAGNVSISYNDTIIFETTPPSNPVVIDEGKITYSLTTLSASWSSIDPESGIIEYQYAIGTRRGSTDVLGWASVGTATSVTRTGLSLKNRKTYYFSVKAKNGFNLWSQVGYSDGIKVVK